MDTRLHRAGWTIGDTPFHAAVGLRWLVLGHDGEHLVLAEGATEDEAGWRACADIPIRRRMGFPLDRLKSRFPSHRRSLDAVASMWPRVHCAQIPTHGMSIQAVRRALSGNGGSNENASGPSRGWDEPPASEQRRGFMRSAANRMPKMATHDRMFGWRFCDLRLLMRPMSTSATGTARWLRVSIHREATRPTGIRITSNDDGRSIGDADVVRRTWPRWSRDMRKNPCRDDPVGSTSEPTQTGSRRIPRPSSGIPEAIPEAVRGIASVFLSNAFGVSIEEGLEMVADAIAGGLIAYRGRSDGFYQIDLPSMESPVLVPIPEGLFTARGR